MCTADEIAAKARQRVRDFGKYFEVPYTAPTWTLRLTHPMVDAKLLQLWLPDGTLFPTDNYTVDQRNGIVKIKNITDIPEGVGASGYYYEWFLDEDLAYAATLVTDQHLYDRDEMEADGSTFSRMECDVIATGAAAQAMWTLVAEFATDIDVSTPEGMAIPAHQRFAQVQQMASYWEGLYKQQAAMLGIGLDRIEQFHIRRVSRLTNRLVPAFRSREVDDPRPPQRILTPRPTGVQDTEGDDQLVYMPEPPGGIAYGGWGTLGTNGSP